MSEPSVVGALASKVNTKAISNTARRAWSIVGGVLAFFAVVTALSWMAAVDYRGAGVLAGIAIGIATILVYWSVQSDNRAAKAANNPLLVTSKTAQDLFVSGAVLFGGVVLAGVFFTLNVPAMFVISGGVITGYYVYRYLLDNLGT